MSLITPLDSASALTSNENQQAEPAEDTDSDSKNKPNSIAAMMETDSISEPAPDDESADGGDDLSCGNHRFDELVTGCDLHFRVAIVVS